jgi:hypothetical protein
LPLKENYYYYLEHTQKYPYTVLYFFSKRFRKTKSDPKFGQTGVVLVTPMPGKKFWNAIPACIMLRKNSWNGVLAHSITKIPLILEE